MDIKVLIEQVREVLIQTNGKINKEDLYDRFVNECNDLGLNEVDFYKKVLSPAYKDAKNKIESENNKKEELEKKEQEKIEKRKEAIEVLQFIAEQCAVDGIFDRNEVKSFFQTSDELGQDERTTAKTLKRFFEKHKYKSATTPVGKSLRLCLESTDWYKEKAENAYSIEEKENPFQSAEPFRPILSVTYPDPPIPKVRPKKPINPVAIVMVLIVLAIAGFGFYINVLKDVSINQKSVRYMASDSVILSRTAPITDSANDIILYIPFGTKIAFIENKSDTEWAYIKYRKNFIGNIKGYVSKKYLLSDSDYYLLEGMFYDTQLKTGTLDINCKLALIAYFKKHNYVEKMNNDQQKEQVTDVSFFPNIDHYNETLPTSAPLSIEYFSALIRDNEKSERKFILFRKEIDGTYKPIYEESAELLGRIKSIRKSSDKYAIKYHKYSDAK